MKFGDIKKEITLNKSYLRFIIASSNVNFESPKKYF